MRALTAMAAAVLTLGVFAASPTLAAHNSGYGQNGQGNNGQGNRYNNDNDEYGDWMNRNYEYNENDRNFGRRGGRDFDNWERSWRPSRGFNQHHARNVLPHKRLIRRIERQGFHYVHDIRPGRFGQGWRAMARDFRGRNVILRVDPYSGHVLNVRRVFV